MDHYNLILNYIKQTQHPLYSKEDIPFDINIQSKLLKEKLLNNGGDINDIWNSLFQFKDRYDKTDKTKIFKDILDKNQSLTSIDEGGLHQENPYGGVAMGGNNKVEQGETKLELNGYKYIFTNRHKII